jgi:hypothetical protein
MANLVRRSSAAFLLAIIGALALASAVYAAGTDPGTFDPQGLDFGLLLTAAGAPVAAAIVASVIQAAKRIPTFGKWLNADNEIVLSMVLAAGVIGYAFSAIAVPVTMASLAMAFLAWLNLIAITSKAYDVAPDSVKTAIGGTSK